MDWSISLDYSQASLMAGKSVLQLCRKSFAFLYGISENLFKVIPKKMRDAGSTHM